MNVSVKYDMRLLRIICTSLNHHCTALLYMFCPLQYKLLTLIINKVFKYNLTKSYYWEV